MQKLDLKTISKYATIGGAGVLILTSGMSVVRGIASGKLPNAMVLVTGLVGVAALTYATQDNATI